MFISIKTIANTRITIISWIEQIYINEILFFFFNRDSTIDLEFSPVMKKFAFHTYKDMHHQSGLFFHCSNNSIVDKKNYCLHNLSFNSHIHVHSWLRHFSFYSLPGLWLTTRITVATDKTHNPLPDYAHINCLVYMNVLKVLMNVNWCSFFA